MGSSSWGAPARMGAGPSGVSLAQARVPGQLRRSGAPRRGLPPSLAVPGARGLARSGRTGPSCRRRRLRRLLLLFLLLPRLAPLFSSCSPSGSLPIPTPPPGPGARGAGGKRLPPRLGAGRAGPRRARGCGAGGRVGARARAGCVCRSSPAEAAAPAKLPREAPPPPRREPRAPSE